MTVASTPRLAGTFFLLNEEVAAELLPPLWQTQSHEGTIQPGHNVTHLNQTVLMCSQWRSSQRGGASERKGPETSVEASTVLLSSNSRTAPAQLSPGSYTVEITDGKGRKMKGNADGEKARQGRQTNQETKKRARGAARETVKQKGKGV